MADNGNGVTFRMSKLQATIFATLFAAAVIALASNLWTLNRGLLEIQIWKTSLDAQDSALRNSLPRGEWVLEKQLINAEFEQIRARIAVLERDGN